MKTLHSLPLRSLLFLCTVYCALCTGPTVRAQTTALTINSGTGLVTIPSGVTPNFSALHVGGVSVGTPPWSAITGTPTTLAGYGITDAVSLTGSQALTNKTYNGLTVIGNGGSLTVASSKYLVVNNQLNLSGNDGATVNFGAGGTIIYLPSQSGNAGKVLQTDGTNLSWQTAGGGTITLSGDVSGSGTSAITTTIGAGHVTNAMLAGSIDLTSKVTGALPVANGGTGQSSITAAKTALGVSNNIVVLSAVSGIHLNSNIDSGGGTDDTSTIQAVLNTAGASAPLWLVWDGVALTSSTLVVKSHTLIAATPHCGFYLANGSNCQALTNQLNGSSIANTDIEIRNLEVNCNGNNQSKWEANTVLTSTTGTSGVTHGTATIDFTPNAVVVPGMKATCTTAGHTTDIPASTYVVSVTSGHAVLTNTVSGSNTGLTFSFAFDSAYDRTVGWVYGLWFEGWQRLKLSGVTVRNAKTFSIVLGNGSDFVIEHCKSLWDDNDGHTLTNNNRDGIHMFGNLDSGHIVDYYNNGDDDSLAFNTDEGSLLGDSRRGSGSAISNIVAENIQLDAGTNALRFYGACGTGTLTNITVRNTHGTIIQGSQSCSPPTVAGTTYLGRTGTDQALASLQQITIDNWDHTAVSPAVTDLTLMGVNKLRLSNIPETTKVTLTGVEDYTGDRAPTWQRYSLAPNAWDNSSHSTGGSFNGGTPGGFGHLEMWSNASGDYAAVTFGQMFSDPWPQAGTTQNVYGTIDWTVPMEAECAFQIVSPASANTIFRWLIGRAASDVSTASIGSWYNGIGISVENQELYLVTAILGTNYHLDTGYSVPLDKLTRVKLRSIGNGVVRVYVEGAGAIDNLVYSCAASQGPTGNTGPNHVEFHNTVTGGSTRSYVAIAGLRIKR